MEALAPVLALLAAAFFALAATLWQKASLSLDGVSLRHPATFIALVIQWVSLLGLASQMLGVGLQAAALDRGRVAIIQPLLVTSVVFAMPLGYLLTGQKVTSRQVLGAAVVVLGLAVFANVGDPAGGIDNAPASEWIAAFAVIAMLCRTLLALRGLGSPTTKAASYGTVAGMLYGVSATLMKPVVEAWHTDGAAVLANWQLWTLAATGIVGFLFQQISLATGRLIASVATVSVANPIVSVALGALVLDERLARPTWHVAVAVCALVVALTGVVVIAFAREGQAMSTAPVPATA
jgi:drug/metabolite transporter (DMT)-like permease